MMNDKDAKVLNIYQAICRELSSMQEIQCYATVETRKSHSDMIWERIDHITKKTYDHEYSDVDYIRHVNSFSDRDASLYKEVCNMIFPEYESMFRVKMFKTKLEMDFKTLMRSLKDENLASTLSKDDITISILTDPNFELDSYDYNQPEFNWVFYQDIRRSIENIYQKIIFINGKSSIIIIKCGESDNRRIEQVGPQVDRLGTWRSDFS